MSGWPKFNFSMSRLRGSSIRAINPRFPYSNAGLDLAFVLNRYALQGSPMSTYTTLSAFLAGVGGTFTRASSGTYFDATGTLQTAASNVPRLDYNPATLAARGYLAEEARTNDALWNRDLTNAAWVKVTATAAKNQTGIDGAANSASSLTATAGNATCLQTVTLGSSARFQSAYVKRLVGSGAIQMTTDNGATWTAVTVTSAWTRVTIPSQTVTNPTFGFRVVTSGDSIAIDCVQNETGAFATSPIPTTNAAVARAADVLSLPTTGWYNASAGSWFAEFLSFDATSTVQRVFSASNGTTANLNEQIFNGTGNSTVAQLVSGAARSSGGVGGQTPVNAINKYAHGADASGVTSAANGNTFSALVSSDTMPTITTLHIGNRFDGARPMNGLIHRIFYVPSREANATIQGWTV